MIYKNIQKAILTSLLFCSSTICYGNDWIAYFGAGISQSADDNGIIYAFSIPQNAVVPPNPLTVPNTSCGAVAISPDSKTAYVLGINGIDLIPVDIATNTVQTSLFFPSDPLYIAITSDGKTAYMTGLDPGILFKVDLASSTLTTIPTGLPDPFDGLAINPDGSKIYIANSSSNNVLIFDTATETQNPQSPINTGAGATYISITPDGKKALVGNRNDNSVSVLDLTSNTLSTTLNIPMTFGFISAVAITPDGSLAYVGTGDDDTVIPITLSDNQLGLPIPTDGTPTGIAFTPDSNTAFTANVCSNSLTKIENIKSASPTVSSFPFTDGFASFVAITPDQAPTASFTYNGGKVNTPSFFDATPSSSPVGSIAYYTWNFGDSSPEITVTTSTISHTYSSVGSFSVKLTVTNTGGTSTTRTFTGQTVSNNGGPSATSTQIINVTNIPLPLPPRNFCGKQITNRFTTQTDYINVLKWNPPKKGTKPLVYIIYRDPTLKNKVAEIPALKKVFQFKFKDHNRHKNRTYNYYIVSKDAAGNISSPAHVTVKP